MQNKEIMTPPFSRIVRLDQVPGTGLTAKIQASEPERAAVAEVLELEGLDALSFAYTLAPLSHDRFKLTGKVEGKAKRLCVVTLDPLDEDISEDVSTEFWPAQQLAQDASIDREVEVSLESPEPLTGSNLDLGQFAFETFAAALDLYPRKPDANFKWKETASEGESAANNPFVALRQLKKS